MALFPRAQQPNAAAIAAQTEKLKGNLTAAKDELKAAKDKRDSLPLDTPKNDAEALNATIRNLEDSIKATEGQLNEGGKRYTATLAAEYIQEQPALWSKMQKELLDIDEHARAIAAATQRLTEMRNKSGDDRRAVHQVGKQNLLLARPMDIAIRAFRAMVFDPKSIHSAERTARNAAVDALAQRMEIVVGPKYSESPVAQIMDLLRTMTPEDAKNENRNAA